MTQVPAFAPGCFGSALAFQGSNAVCRACSFKTECQTMHETNLAALRTRFGIDAKRGPKVRLARPSKEITGETSGLELPRKTRELVEWLDKSNLNVIEKMRAGINPFDGKTRGFMRAVAHVLMNVDQPVARPTLVAAFMKKFNWTEGTAAAHVRMAYQALGHIGAITETDAGAVLRR